MGDPGNTPAEHAHNATMQLQDKVTEITRWNLWKAEPNIWVHAPP